MRLKRILVWGHTNPSPPPRPSQNYQVREYGSNLLLHVLIPDAHPADLDEDVTPTLKRKASSPKIDSKLGEFTGIVQNFREGLTAMKAARLKALDEEYAAKRREVDEEFQKEIVAKKEAIKKILMKD